MQTYTLTDNNTIDSMIVTSVGNYFISDIESYDCIVKPEETSWQINQLAKEFKSEKNTIKKMIKDRKQQLSELVERETFIKNWYYFKAKGKVKLTEWDYQFTYVTKPRTQTEREIQRLEKILLYMQKGKGGEFDVEKARERPITDFIEFNRSGFARSIWNPQDKTPSMKYYKKENRVHCFSTGEDEDVIGVVMQLHSCNFIEAVKIIMQ